MNVFTVKWLRRALPACVALGLVMSGFAQAETPNVAQDFFPDTKENRLLSQKSYDHLLDVDKKHGHFIEVNGIKMHYLEWGDKNGVPLIWSHGYGSTGFELLNVAPQLAAAGYHVYSITYRGFGQTQVADTNFSLSHVADDIVAMMDKLGIEKAVIGGLSLGGGVTTTFYENYPERALALVLEDGGSDTNQSRTETSFAVFKDLFSKMPSMDEQPIFKDRFSGLQALARQFNLPDIPFAVLTTLQSFVIPNGEGGYTRHDNRKKLWGLTQDTINPAMNHKVSLLQQSWRRINPFITYRNLSVPMLIIDPTGDFLDLTAENEKLRDMHPDLIDLVLYPDTPHQAHPVRPEWFVRDMKTLLGRLK